MQGSTAPTTQPEWPLPNAASIRAFLDAAPSGSDTPPINLRWVQAFAHLQSFCLHGMEQFRGNPPPDVHHWWVRNSNLQPTLIIPVRAPEQSFRDGLCGVAAMLGQLEDALMSPA